VAQLIMPNQMGLNLFLIESLYDKRI